MKAKNWEFKKIFPDLEDSEARMKACSKFFETPYEKYCTNQGELKVGIFSSAFNRGIAWAKAKYKIKD